MLIPFGVLSAAGAGGVVPFESDYELISTTVLGGTAASVTFSSLGDYSSTYKHLQIRATIRTARTGSTGDAYLVRLNGDSATNYNWHYLRGTGSVSSTGAANESAIVINRVGAASDPSNVFGPSILDILDPYSTTKNTTIRGLTGVNLPGPVSFGEIHLTSGAWRNTAALTSIVLSNGFDFVSGSRFSLYGIKG
jgi:hypothetical protein